MSEPKRGAPRGRRPRPRVVRPRSRSLVGSEYAVEVGPVAHGGHCVARLPEEFPDVGGTVVFVRHAIPGERVTVRVTEGAVGDRFLRGDAVAVSRPSPDRVPVPCSYAGPGLCGGCDFQHIDPAAQRRLKGEVVAEQLRRLAGLNVPVHVEAVSGDDGGLRWRTRMRFHRTADGGLGLRAHRSHRVVPLDDCLIQAPGARITVTEPPVRGSERTERLEGTHPAGRTVTETVRGEPFAVAEDGFWQVHVGAPETLVGAVLELADAQPGDRVLDLFSGVGLFAAFLAQAVGERGHVVAVEGDRRASELAVANLAAYPWAETVTAAVDQALANGPDGTPALAGGHDVVVLDPPRKGAGRQVVEAVAGRRPRTVVYVACDPAALARDVAFFAAVGYRLEALRAFDLFPMTHHVECVALLEKTGPEVRRSDTR